MLWAARIIEQHFDLVHRIRGEAATIDRWLSVLPAEVVRSRPRLLLAQAHMAADSGHPEVVEPLLDAVECAPPGWADEPFEPASGAAASFLINVPALTTLNRSYLAQLHGDAEATAAFATQTLAESKPEERALSATAHGFLAVAEWLRGRLTEAERALASSVTGWRETGQLTLIAWGCYELVLIQLAQGRLDAAALTCEQALDSLVTSGRPAPAAGPSYAGLAEIAYQRDELDVALRHATEGIALCRQFVYTPPLAGGLATLAMIRQATGDPAGALEAITEAGQAAPGPAGPAQPGPRPAGPAAAGPGRPGRRGPFRAGERPRPGRRAGLRPRVRAPGAGPDPARPGPARPGAGTAGPAARRGGRPGPYRQPDRDRRAAGAGAGRHRR